ncbi:MAG: serine protease [Planctomycetes bacterium]|nr:serine protease [Planctomycetota bacterium]
MATTFRRFAGMLAAIVLLTATGVHATPAEPAASDPFVTIYANVAPSVVRVIGGEYYASGIIVSDDGLVVTHTDVAVNNTLSVYLPDKPETKARLLVRNRRLGLAVLQLVAGENESDKDADDPADESTETKPKETPRPAAWPAARFGSSGDMKSGNWVATVAYPKGSDEKQLTSPAISTGLLSARGKFPTRLKYKDELLLTDAAVNSGSEGGALVDNQGRVVGILVRPQHHKQTDTALNLALPIEALAPLVKKARENPDPPRDETRKPAFLGVISDETTDRCRIARIINDGPAAKAGLKPGDVIVEADGIAVESFDDLLDVLDEKSAGDEIKLTVSRKNADGEQAREEFTVTLGERPERP